MRNEVNNWQKLFFFYTKLQNKTQCVGFSKRPYKTNHNTDGPFLLQDRKKVSVSMLFQKVCLGRKLSPIISRQVVGIRMSWVEKNRKTN